MKLNRKLMMTLIAVLLSAQTALADGNLSATLNEDVLSIYWTAEGPCVLTVYRDHWPISVSNVDGASGGTQMRVPSEGSYSVRLKMGDGCEMVEVTTQDGVSPAQTAKPTVAPIATIAPTAAVTAKPTAVPTATAQSGQSMTSLAAQVITQVNAERAKYGLSELSVNAELTRAACVRAGEIAERFSHTRPDGSQWSTVSRSALGENIARGQSSVDRVMAAWMSSEGHRANILRESYGSIGVCALQVNGVIHWVQLFGK